MKQALIINLFLVSFNLMAGIGGSGGGVSLSWNSILNSEKYQVKGAQIVFEQGISSVYTPVIETCVREIESDPIIETQNKVYFKELDNYNKQIEVHDYLAKSIRDFKISPLKKYSLDVYVKTNKFSPIDERNKFTKDFEIPKCEDFK